MPASNIIEYHPRHLPTKQSLKLKACLDLAEEEKKLMVDVTQDLVMLIKNVLFSKVQVGIIILIFLLFYLGDTQKFFIDW